MSTEHAIQERRADRIFARLTKLRAGYRCEWCSNMFPATFLQCSHFVDRRHHATRWEEKNVDSLCVPHHQLLEDRKDRNEWYYEWKRERLGEEAFRELLRLRETIAKFSAYDLKNLCDAFLREIHTLERNRAGGLGFPFGETIGRFPGSPIQF